MAPVVTICDLLSAEEARCHSAPDANFWALIDSDARRVTSGGMAPASAMMALLVPSAPSCQSAPLACVCVAIEPLESIAMSGLTPPASTIDFLLSDERARSASTAAALSCGVFARTRRPSPRRRTSGSMALAAVMALRLSSERAARTASASAAFIWESALRRSSTATRRLTTALRESTSCEAR